MAGVSPLSRKASRPCAGPLGILSNEVSPKPSPAGASLNPSRVTRYPLSALRHFFLRCSTRAPDYQGTLRNRKLARSACGFGRLLVEQQSGLPGQLQGRLPVELLAGQPVKLPVELLPRQPVEQPVQ
jgi:hypothetical protein